MKIFLLSILTCFLLSSLRAQEPADADSGEIEDIDDETLDRLLDEAIDEYEGERGDEEDEDVGEFDDTQLDQAIDESLDDALLAMENEEGEGERGFWKKLKGLGGRWKNSLKNKWKQAKKYGKHKFNKGKKFIGNLWNKAKHNTKKFFSGGKKFFKKVWGGFKNKMKQLGHKVKNAFAQKQQQTIVGKPILPHCGSHDQCMVNGTPEEVKAQCLKKATLPLEQQGVLGCEYDECCKICKCEGVTTCVSSKKRSLKNKSCLKAKKKTCLLKGKQVLGC